MQFGGRAGLQKSTGELGLIVFVVPMTDQGQVDSSEVTLGLIILSPGRGRQTSIDRIGLDHHAVDHDTGLPRADDHALVGQLR